MFLEKKNAKFVISEARDPQKIPKNIQSMYFFPLNTIPVLLCPYCYKKRRKIQKIVFPLHGNQILSSDLDSSSNFTSIIVVRIFFFSLLYKRENTRCKNDEKPMFAETGANPHAITNFCHFRILCFLDYTNVKKKICAPL